MKHELLTLANVGPATLKELAKQDADDLYQRLQATTHSRQDPCVWAWTKIRKAQQ